MPVTPETLLLLDQMNLDLTAVLDGHTRQMAAAWARAWDEVADSLQVAVTDALDAGWTQARLIRTEKATAALLRIAEQLDGLAADAGIRITNALGDVVTAASRAEQALITSQLPTVASSIVQPTSAEVLQAIVTRSTQQITAATQPLSAEAEDAVRRALIRGVALGDNPRETARRIVARAEHGFNGGLTRALTIARTETLDAHRAAQHAADQANTATLGGWQWIAALTDRTCPSCWAMHGTRHPVSEVGPLDHQNGRCTRLPVTKSWADLGFPELDEPADQLTDARAAFDALDRNTQVGVMGRRRLDLLDAGMPWSELSTRRDTPGWRPSYTVTPLMDLPVPA